MFMDTYRTVVTRGPGGPELEGQMLSTWSREPQRWLWQRRVPLSPAGTANLHPSTLPLLHMPTPHLPFPPGVIALGD